ncbi:MAG: hypothetical protein R2764_12550 [Bacteroidales bacterium]
MKKKTRGIHFLLLVSAIFLTGCVTTNLPEYYTVNPEVLEAKGGRVTFTIDGTFPAKSFHKKAVVEFSPYLKFGDERIELKKLILKGEKAEGEGTIINSKTGGSFAYSDEFLYTHNMRASELYVDAKIRKGSKISEYNNIKLADGVIHTYQDIIHDEELIYAPSGYEPITIVSENATLYFRVNSADLNMNLALNKDEEAIAKMKELEDFLMKGWDVKDIKINAWASPEGEIHFNDNLATKRADAASKFMKSKLTGINKKRAKALGVDVSSLEKEVAYSASGNGEDWDGFMTAIKNSDLKDKNQILNVVNSQSDVTKREEEIRNMTVIYKEIEETILPPLRRAEITVNCFEPKRTDEEMAELVMTNPDELTYAEIMHTATLTDDPTARYNIYQTAFTNKDRDWKAYNNAAAEAIVLNKLNEAGNLLIQAEKLAKDNGKIENNLGVLACHENNYEAAEQYFMKAMSHGENENYNLGVVSIQKGDYAKALNYFKGIDCKHNVALAQVLSGNMNDGLKNLKCSPESAQTNYLLAVYGARSNNADMVYEYLAKAINKDASMKAKAKEDREFLKLFDEHAFAQLVN